MAMIEKGVDPKDFLNPNKSSNPYGILKWALLLVGVGLRSLYRKSAGNLYSYAGRSLIFRLRPFSLEDWDLPLPL